MMMGCTNYVIVFLLIWIINYANYAGSISVQQCQNEMGMANGMLRNDQLLASSNEDHVGYARLYGERAWRAESHSDEWFQVDFRRLVHVSAITTQGFHASHQVQCVSRYRVAHAIEEDEWRFVMDPENEDERVFSGNHDRSSPVYHVFHRPIRLRYLRIDIVGCKHQCALRFELYGCELHHVPITTTRYPAPGPLTLPRISGRLPRVTNKATTMTRLTTPTPTTPKAHTTVRQLLTTKPRTITANGRVNKGIAQATTSSISTKASRVIPTTSKGGLFANAAAKPAGKSSSSSAKNIMKKESIIGVAACAGLLLIVLAIVGIWLYKRNRSSSGSKQVAVMQNIGPYEITTPGLSSTRNVSYEAIPDVPDTDTTADHDNAAYVITQIGPNAGGNQGTVGSQGTGPTSGQKDKRTSGWEDNKIYAVND